MITQNEGGIVVDLGNILVVGPDWASIQALNKAHADALAEIHQVGFDSKHQQGWTYASFDAIANVLRPVLAKHGLSVAPTMDSAEIKENGQNKYGNIEWLATACISLALMHSGGAMRVTKHQGQGSDYSDKAINKAWTVAAKYALMRLFLISTGEKDENDDDDKATTGKTAKATEQERKPEHAKAQAEPAKAEPPKVQVVVNGKPTRPYPPETLKAGMTQRAEKAAAMVATDGHRGAMVGAVEALFSGDSKEIATGKRHMVLKYLFGKDSSKELTGGQVHAVLGWAQEKIVESGEYAPDPVAAQEAALIVKAVDVAAGQTSLL